MLANGWQALFKPHILDRGETYWQQGHVAELHRTPDGIHAVVTGSEDYEVEIELEDGMVCDMYCSCPYAEDGSACKHMAAVLFAAEDCPGDVMEAAGDDNDGGIPAPVWQETLRQMTTEQLRSFLLEILPHSTGLQEQLLLSCRQGQDDTLLRDCWEAQLRQTVRRFRGGRQEIDYAHADAFYTALNRFLTDRFPALLRRKAVMPAFSLVCAVYCTAMEEEADDSDGGMSLLMHTCEDAWHNLMSAASARQCVEMHRWFAGQVVSRPDAFGMDLLEKILFCGDWTAECLWKNLALLDDLLKKTPDREYRAAALLEWRADTMQALGLPEADIEAFWSRYRSYSFVRDRERNRLLAERAYDKVIPLLQEEKQLAENDLWRQRQCSAELIRLYQLTGQQEAYRQELCAQVETYPQHDLEFIHALRGITPDGQWPEQLEQLLQLPSTNAIRLALLADSGQWPRLFAELEQHGLLHLLEAYMEPLAAWDTEKTLTLFSRLIDTEMDRAYDRDAYRRTIDRVRILRRYPGGDRMIARLLKGWRERYSRRTAMLDELNKAKRAGRL